MLLKKTLTATWTDAPRASHDGDEFSQRASAAMVRYAADDPQAFDELYALLAPRLYRLSSYLIGRDEAVDVVQEVLLKMHRARGTFAQGGNVVTWSYAITRATCIDRWRRRAVRTESAAEPQQMERRAAHDGAGPEQSAVGRALEATVQAQLLELSESLRSAYVLVKLEGLGSAEAARILGCNSSTVKQRVHRANQAIKRGLEAAGWTVEGI